MKHCHGAHRVTKYIQNSSLRSKPQAIFAFRARSIFKSFSPHKACIIISTRTRLVQKRRNCVDSHHSVHMQRKLKLFFQRGMIRRLLTELGRAAREKILVSRTFWYTTAAFSEIPRNPDHKTHRIGAPPVMGPFICKKPICICICIDV